MPRVLPVSSSSVQQNSLDLKPLASRMLLCCLLKHVILTISFADGNDKKSALNFVTLTELVALKNFPHVFSF